MHEAGMKVRGLEAWVICRRLSFDLPGENEALIAGRIHMAVRVLFCEVLETKKQSYGDRIFWSSLWDMGVWQVKVQTWW